MHSDNEMVRLRDVVETLIYMTDEDSDGVEEVMQLPTIDIIRCQDCKYWRESRYYPEVMACTYVKGATFTRQHDDFCSRGERKSDE